MDEEIICLSKEDWKTIVKKKVCKKVIEQLNSERSKQSKAAKLTTYIQRVKNSELL